jgi:hypothetical protein
VHALEVLHLASCGLGKAAAPVLEHLPQLASLKALRLEDNALAGAAFSAAADAVARCSALSELRVSGNPLGSVATGDDSGVAGLLGCMERLPQLQRLEANGTALTQEDGARVLAAVATAHSLRCVHLRQPERLDAAAAKGSLVGLQELVV